MSINLNTLGQPERFTSRHGLRTVTGDQKTLIVLSGIALVNYTRSNINSGDPANWRWFATPVHLDIDLEAVLPPTDQKWFVLEQSVPLVNISSFWVPPWNVDTNPHEVLLAADVGPGAAIDRFEIRTTNLPLRSIPLQVVMAVSFPFSAIWGLSYHLTLIGSLVPPPDAPG